MIPILENTFDFLLNRPILMLVAMGIPLWIAAVTVRLYPSRRLLYFVFVPAALSIGLIALPQNSDTENFQLQWVVMAIAVLDGGLILAMIADALFTIRQHHFVCRRRIQQTASLGKRYPVEIELINRSKRGCFVAVRDDLPETFEAEPSQFSTWIQGASRTQFTYDYICNQRGIAEFECVHVVVGSPMGLWRGFYEVPLSSSVNVYPDMQQISEYDLLARTNRLNLMGLRRSRKIGQDNEFERLRDYTQDDNFKHIDWRATARRRKLTVRDFQANQSQRIIFMIDSGRMMTATSGELSLLDHSINAMLMLSYVALRQGDSVGLISFSDQVHSYIPPKSGVKHINRLLHASFNLDADYVESRYDDAFMYLRTHCPRRALVVLITNVIDDINAVQIKQYLNMMNGRHLPMGVLLRDHDLFGAIEEFEAAQTGAPAGSPEINRKEKLFQAAAAASVLTWRHQVIRDLKHSGVLALDVFPENLTSQLVNQYLEVKARHLL